MTTSTYFVLVMLSLLTLVSIWLTVEIVVAFLEFLRTRIDEDEHE